MMDTLEAFRGFTHCSVMDVVNVITEAHHFMDLMAIRPGHAYININEYNTHRYNIRDDNDKVLPLVEKKD